MILSIVTLWYPDYQWQHWQLWLIYVALIWLAVSLNVFGSSLIPLYNQLTCMYLKSHPKCLKRLKSTQTQLLTY
jgi:hypothetical protein